jgi:predicted nicotinamide N-methyase
MDLNQPFTSLPETDPTALFRVRDGIYAADLLIAAVGWLDLFSWLASHPSDPEGICTALDLAPRPIDVLLTLAAAMGLVQRQGQRIVVTDLARDHLTSASPWSMVPYYNSMRERPICRDLLDVLKTGRPINWGSKEDEEAWAKAMEQEGFAERFTAAMDSRGAALAPAMARHLDLTTSTRLLDVAGGSGIYACAVVAEHAHMTAAVLERPPVDQVARRSLARKGMGERVSVVGADMFEGLPEGYDVHLFSNVLHDWGAAAVRKLLTHSHAALKPGGEILIHDAHIDADKCGPLEVAQYSVLLMASTEGKCYAVSELEMMLTETGFEDVTCTSTAAYRSVVRARRV